MDFSDRIRSYQRQTIYSDLSNRSLGSGGSTCVTTACSGNGCKVNFITYELREAVRQGRADLTGNSNLLAAYLGPNYNSNY